MIDDVLGCLRFVQGVAAEAKPAGRTPLEAARETGLGPCTELTDSERIVGDLYRAYAELDGLEPGGQVDAVAALTDMVRSTAADR